ncbi:aspartate aminotransferase family protein [Virgibacillus salexigens]|uniref:Taurine--pyruvate aminotransferase n=2 Tax=Virgibacillus TaxID=84406 RepID=A0A024QIA2_9BACI|nr:MULTISPECIES: aspartate aminotransferase family protein [Virgibacillus]MYL43184.1 aminotransferase class III-fold pyridoxal phosphate-dependent enzyme [Virgibacillus massiliensis]GGJ64306.1 putative aminotransferase YhxA [Virgibacillus kapii]CDQ41686.1 Taurine--pyruvate aminotransferase [Virgibacillus massiliensis]
MDTKVEKKALLEKDEKYLWHAMKKYNPEGTMISTHADGVWVTDIEGNKYLDAQAGLWCVNVGYGRDELADVCAEQLKQMPYYPLTQSHIPGIQLSEKLNQWLEDDYVIFYSNSGSEANETAFKIARQYYQQANQPNRYKFVSRYRSYHGSSLATLAAGGQNQRAYKYEPLASGFVHISPPDCYRSPFPQDTMACCLHAADELDRTLTWEISDTVAGFIMEPIITGGGVLVPHDNYMKRVREICDKHGVLLIADEVINGFGRTGKPFGFMHYDVKPDIITMAKGLTSGYMPLAATAVKREIYEEFTASATPYDHFRHVNTFGGSPAACAVAIRNLEIMEEEQLISNSKQLGVYLLEELQDLLQHPHVGDIRGKGLLAGIELVKDKQTKEPIEEKLAAQVVNECKQKGVIIGKTSDTVDGYNNIITMSPPLSITKAEISHLTSVLKEAIIKL